MKHETKNETLKSYVSLSEMTDSQLLYNKKWNMKDKSKVLKMYGYYIRESADKKCVREEWGKFTGYKLL